MNYDFVDLVFLGALIILLVIIAVFFWRVIFPEMQPSEEEANRESEINLTEHHGHPDVRQHRLRSDPPIGICSMLGGVHHR